MDAKTSQTASWDVDAPPSSLMDSTTNPKVKTTEGEKIGHVTLLTTLQG
jgi:hypothetical protein